ncbi:pyrroline-5-carboxylate reductase [[Limnothrix rosea] IAM M-220]|uniref:pyrroline-5-carboxylate reductase n=1 Tax=[Limnothrix rosea] IAM M-220 TaxID=454133 RepID=UPI000959C88C|nr:pyrroline-5-carboxylate reductase [[Limnothrix rosea] IAM M-220]OKH16099.1 pyrroline-5-carboxylate reductase [[Limnothrix rosea] IAM M-220]
MAVKFGMIGGGVMGEALLSRLLKQGLYRPSDVVVSEPVAARRDYLQQEYGVSVTASNGDAASATDVLMLAIKPQIFDKVTAELQSKGLMERPLVLSILAGVALDKLSAGFEGYPVVRVMPNTPAIVGQGMTAIAPSDLVLPEQVELAKQIFAAVGEVVEVPEYLMDAVTGLSGSGPAFVALMIEALADGGVASGLPRPIAQQLALQTVKGTAELLQDSGLHPAQLKDRVTSPGGTTIAGVATLEANGFRSAVIEAVKAAKQRSEELGQ